MKALKYISAMLPALLLLLSLVACGPVSDITITYDEAQMNEFRSIAEGTWKLTEFDANGTTYTFEEYCKKDNLDPAEMNTVFTFNLDATGEGTFGEETLSFTYFFNGKRATVKTENGDLTFEYSEEKDAFYIYDSTTNTYGYLTRQ